MPMVDQSAFRNKETMVRAYVDYFNSTLTKAEPKPESPNHASPFSLKDFEKSLEELAEPFNGVLKEYYAN